MPGPSLEDDGWRPLSIPPAAQVPLTDTPFGRLAVAHAFSLAGDTLVTMALAGSLFFSISPTAARERVALSLVITMAPFAVVAPFLGPLIDRSRWGRRALMALTGLGRAAACLAMAQVLDELLLFPAAFTVLVLAKAYSVIKSSLVPGAVDGDHELVEANARLSMVGVVAGFVAAVPAALLLRFAGAQWVLGLAAALFVAAAVTSARVVERRRLAADGDGAEASADASVVASPAGIPLAAVAMALLRSVVGFLTFLVAFDFRRDGAPSWWFGIVLAASMGSTLLGAMVAPSLRLRFREEQIIAGSLALVGVVAFAMTQVGGRLPAALLAAAVGLAASAGRFAFDALVQRDAPEAVRGRAFARFEAGFQLVWVVGALLPVVITTSLRNGFAVVGVAATLAGVAYVGGRRAVARGVVPWAA